MFGESEAAFGQAGTFANDGEPALNGYPEVSEATRERVLKAAQQTGYKPNKAAQRLATGKAKSIAS